MKLTNRATNIIAALLLGLCFLFAFLSTQNMSLTMDEKAHIPSGYSYLAFQDYRLNPEHPPLAKDLSAVPLLFLNLNFPTDKPCWTKDVNGQWDCGDEFIFKSGNNPDQIIFWARLPMMLLLIFMGWFIFFWTRKLGGDKPALLVLTIFSFSPTFLAHGRLVTTDVAAAFGFLFATYFWLKFLKNPRFKNVFISGIALGIALCLKFSTILLIPSFAIITIVYACCRKEKMSAKIKEILKYIGLSVVSGIVALILIVWPIYQFHTANYPPERQLRDSEEMLKSNDFPLKSLFIYTADKPIIRPISQYALGLLMATQRVAGGNTTYFLGRVSGEARKAYFPVMYLLKVPLSFHLLTLLVLLLWVLSWKKTKPFRKIKLLLKPWLLKYFPEFSLLVLFAVYWITSVSGNLNIGIRHILPTFPVVYILVSLGLFRLLEKMKKRPKVIIVSLSIGLIAWYISSSLIAFPQYLSYYNELIGGSKNGYKYAVDSNYDWGQDLKRLVQFVEKNNIQKIKVAYFGGDDTNYRLGSRVTQTWIDKDPAKNKGWIAISATFLQEKRALPAPGFNKDTTELMWLNKYHPIRIGNSIFVYHID